MKEDANALYDVIFHPRYKKKELEDVQKIIVKLKKDIFTWQYQASRLFENEARATERVIEAQKLLTRCNLWLPETR